MARPASATENAYQKLIRASKHTAQWMKRTAHWAWFSPSQVFLKISRTITAEYIEGLEQTLDGFNDALPPLKEFILPGGGAAASACHLARAITRRAERLTWSAMQTEDIAREVPQYLNRLSDLLFVVARVLARRESGQEVLWQPGRR